VTMSLLRQANWEDIWKYPTGKKHNGPFQYIVTHNLIFHWAILISCKLC